MPTRFLGFVLFRVVRDFHTRHPSGGPLPVPVHLIMDEFAFQSAPSLRMVTMASCTTALRMLLFQPTPSLRMVTTAGGKEPCLAEFQSTPSLRMVTANLYNDTQYFLYRFGEIHNFVLYTSYLLRFTLPWCGFAGHFSVRSSRKFYDCLGFALHRQTQHLIHYTMNAAL